MEVEIEGGGVRQEIEVELTPAWSPFAFVTEPPGASLQVDGEPIGTLGATGRVTGPHLDWRINWFDRRLDPALLVGPMPEADG